jgi:acetylglutamate kinase
MMPLTDVADTGAGQRPAATTPAATTVGGPEIGAPVTAVLKGLTQLRAWRGRTVTIKYGGAAMGRADLRAAFAHDVARLHAAGVNPVVVHGGGPEIDALMRRLGKVPRFSGGLRVSDEETVELAEMVLVGRINPEIVGLINRHGGHAIGLSGKDDDLLLARRRPPHRSPTGELVDLGLVGDIEAVNAAPLRLLGAHGRIPVIAPIATDENGATYNVNADHAAGAIAAALDAAALVQLTDVPGILDRDGHALELVSRRGLERLIRERVVEGGMLPKVDAALTALEAGAARVRIVDGRQPHAVARALLAAERFGTEIVR